MKRPLEKCANGCDAKPHPPSLVICKRCLDRISATLRWLADGKQGDPPDPPEPQERDALIGGEG